jgi:hypothetical protein
MSSGYPGWDSPESNDEILARDTVRVVRRGCECDGKVTERNIEKILPHHISSHPQNQKLETHLDVVRELKLKEDDLDETETEQQVPRILLPLDESTVARYEFLA